MRIVITGHMGFVGRHMMRKLHMLYPQAHIVGVDIRSPQSVDARKWFSLDEDDTFMLVHCAAVVGGRQMIEKLPAYLAAEDLAIDGEMWRWALRTKPEHVVYFSSSAAYPIELQSFKGYKLRESDISLHMPREPDQTYGWVKLIGEVMAREVQAAGVRVHVFRPFSGYGADQDLTYPFPAIMRRARLREDPFHVWGSGEQRRDWVHIDDVIDCVLAAIDQDYPDPLNICTGIPTSFLDLASKAMTAAGYVGLVVPQEDKPAGVLWRCGNPDNMLKVYTPKVSLEEGIRRALDV